MFKELFMREKILIKIRRTCEVKLPILGPPRWIRERKL